MRIDTSFLDETNVVIRCETQQEANTLFDNVCLLLPEWSENLRYRTNSFEEMKDDDGFGYRFTNRNGKRDIGWGSIGYYRAYGYKIIDLSELLTPDDYGDFELWFTSADEGIQLLF